MKQKKDILNEYFTNLLIKLNLDNITYATKLEEDYHYCSRRVDYIKIGEDLVFKLVERIFGGGSTYIDNKVIQRSLTYGVVVLVGEDSDVFKDITKTSPIDIIRIYTNNKDIINNISREWDIEFNYIELLNELRKYIKPYNNINLQE